MKLILASNILEHPGFFDFLRAAGERYPSASFLVSGDLLNIFPEPGEDLEGSIFHELFGGRLITDEMNRLVKGRFADAKSSRFLEPLEEMFRPVGSRFEEASQLAEARYARMMKPLAAALGDRSLYFIPGNMDYPRLAASAIAPYPRIRMFDHEVIVLDGVRVGAVGGVPNTVHPFRGVAEISPYEMAEAEYVRRLNSLWGVDVLVTHVSPQECPALKTFVVESPLKLLICRAAFNFNRDSDFRGKLEVQDLAGKKVIQVRPYDFPVNHALVVEISRERLLPLEVEVFSHAAVGPAALGHQRTGDGEHDLVALAERIRVPVESVPSLDQLAEV